MDAFHECIKVWRNNPVSKVSSCIRGKNALLCWRLSPPQASTNANHCVTSQSLNVFNIIIITRPHGGQEIISRPPQTCHQSPGRLRDLDKAEDYTRLLCWTQINFVMSANLEDTAEINVMWTQWHSHRTSVRCLGLGSPSSNTGAGHSSVLLFCCCWFCCKEGLIFSPLWFLLNVALLLL